MAVVLSISSDVMRGHVGNAAIRFSLQRLGHEVWAVPTVVLSNHPGHPHVAGMRIPAETIAAMLGALEANGWLGRIDAVLTGYLPSAEHVEMAADAVERIRRLRPDLLVLCDPVLGDHPKGLYIDERAARAIRSRLLPGASLATPNRFELEWLTGETVTGVESAASAAGRLGVAMVLVTSVPVGDSRLANVLRTTAETLVEEVPRRPSAPHGTGDLMSALLLGWLLEAKPPRAALALAARGVEQVIDASALSDELNVVIHQHKWSTADP